VTEGVHGVSRGKGTTTCSLVSGLPFLSVVPKACGISTENGVANCSAAPASNSTKTVGESNVPS
jgi:hypothetical protein